MRASALAVLFFLLAACGNPAAKVQPTPTQATARPSAMPGQASHVFVIVMENRNYSQAIAGRYTAQLSAEYATAVDYHGVAFPSLPNYLALTSGSTWSIDDDGYYRLPAGGLGAQLTSAGIEWRAYMEGMSRGCFNSPYPYAIHHNPFAYYSGTCPRQVVNFTDFATDMNGDVPRFVWITPDQCHNGHDCSTAVADQWLSHVVPMILATSAWQNDGLLFITWDEGEDGANHVLTLAIQPNAKAHVSRERYNHYSLLATIQDRLGVARLGGAVFATPMIDLLANAS